MMGEVVAWKVEIHGMTCIVFAATAPKARWLAVKAYWEAYTKDGWPRPVAWREKRFDNHYLAKEHNGRCFSPEYLERGAQP